MIAKPQPNDHQIITKQPNNNHPPKLPQSHNNLGCCPFIVKANVLFTLTCTVDLQEVPMFSTLRYTVHRPLHKTSRGRPKKWFQSFSAAFSKNFKQLSHSLSSDTKKHFHFYFCKHFPIPCKIRARLFGENFELSWKWLKLFCRQKKLFDAGAEEHNIFESRSCGCVVVVRWRSGRLVLVWWSFGGRLGLLGGLVNNCCRWLVCFVVAGLTIDWWIVDGLLVGNRCDVYSLSTALTTWLSFGKTICSH